MMENNGDVLYKSIEQSRGLDDLKKVGKKKPVGYLPVSTIRSLGFDSLRVGQYFKGKGLATKILNDKDLIDSLPDEQKGANPSNFLYVYDRKALSRLLDVNLAILQESDWPNDPDEFVETLSKRQEKIGTPLYKLIAEAFGDKFSKNLEA